MKQSPPRFNSQHVYSRYYSCECLNCSIYNLELSVCLGWTAGWLSNNNIRRMFKTGLAQLMTLPATESRDRKYITWHISTFHHHIHIKCFNHQSIARQFWIQTSDNEIMLYIYSPLSSHIKYACLQSWTSSDHQLGVVTRGGAKQLFIYLTRV